jgi:hypothetical protein
MTVLSQDIDTTNIDTASLRRGGRVAVFGIRKPDGTIVARRIERRLVSDGSHVRGVPQQDGARIRIGGLVLETASRHLLGKQTLVRFATNGQRQRVVRIETEAVVPGLRHGFVNVETYGHEERGHVALGLGILAPGDRMQLSADGHGFVDLSVRDSSRMAGPGNGPGPRNGGPPPDGGGPPDRSPFSAWMGESRAGGRAAGHPADLEGLEAHRVRPALQAAQPVLRDPARNNPVYDSLDTWENFPCTIAAILVPVTAGVNRRLSVRWRPLGR